MGYDQVVLADSPSYFWKLLDLSGGATETVAATNAGTYSGTVTRGQPGIGDGENAVLLDGSTGYIYTTSSFAGPSVYSVEIWFKTSTNHGGALISFTSDQQVPANVSFDRTVWMGDDGTVNYFNYNAGQQYTNSTKAYNDGAWHHVVATLDAGGQSLYIDGVLVTHSANTVAAAYTGFWRIGEMFVSAGSGVTPASTSNYFAGTIAKAAVYPVALSATQVAAHFNSASEYATAQAVYLPGTLGPKSAGPTFFADPNHWRQPDSAAFPSRIRTYGRTLVDANGVAIPKLKGFNMIPVPWSLQAHQDIAALAASAPGQQAFIRKVVFWDWWEPTAGNIDATQLAALDAELVSAETAGIYTMLDLHLLDGHMPSWTSSVPNHTDAYVTYGQFITQYLANRYGNINSPNYRASVIGFGLNEPPVDLSRLNDGSGIPYLEGQYRQMISWFRAAGYAPDWIGFVGTAYSQQTPIQVLGTNGNMIEADPHAYDSVGGNVVYDIHDYMAWDTRTSPPYDGRTGNGMTYPDWQGATWNPVTHQYEGGGTLVGIGDFASFPFYVTSPLHRSQQIAFIAPYAMFCANAGIPLMIGEWGWSQTYPDGITSGQEPFMADKLNEWATAGAAIEVQWVYDVTADTVADTWAARPGGTWDISTVLWMSGSGTPEGAPFTRSFLPRTRGPQAVGPTFFAALTPQVSAVTVPALTASTTDTSLSTTVCSRTLSLSYSAADTSVSSDSITSTKSAPRTTADTSVSSDSLTRNLQAPRTAADTSLSSDTATRTESQARSSADTSLSTSVLTRGALSAPRTTTDTSLSSDVATPTTVLFLLQLTSPTLLYRGLSQEAFRGFILRNEMVGEDEPYGRIRSRFIRYRDIADGEQFWVGLTGPPLGTSSVGTSDVSLSTTSCTRVLFLPRSTTDTSISSDAVTQTASDLRATADTSASSDVLSRGTLIEGRSVADTSVSTTIIVRTLSLLRSTADTSLSTEVIVLAKGYARPIADISLSTDTLTRGALIVTRTTADASISTTASVRKLFSVRSATDTSLTTDSTTAVKGVGRFPADTSLSTDSASRILFLPRSTADNSLSSDIATPVTRFPRSSADSSTSADAITRVITLPRSISDTSLSSDATTHGALHYTRTSADTSLSTDTTNTIEREPRSVSDISLSSDSTSRHLIFARTFADTSLSADVVSRRVRYPRTTTDTSTTIDILIVGTGAPPPIQFPTKSLLRGLASSSSVESTESNSIIRTLISLTVIAGHPALTEQLAALITSSFVFQRGSTNSTVGALTTVSSIFPYVRSSASSIQEIATMVKSDA